MNIVAAENEASVILVLVKIWGLRADGICVSVINKMKSKEEEAYDPQKGFDQSSDNIKRLALLGSESLYNLYQEDQEVEK